MSATRRIGFPLRLAWNRLVHGTGRAALLALGIAAAAAALAAVVGGSLVAQDEALARALQRVPANERSVSVVYSDLGVTRNGVTREDVEPLVDRTLAGLAPGAPVRAVQLKLLRIGGQLTNLAATDDVGRFVRLTSGRLPETCTPQRCEVVQLGGEGRVPSVEGLRFVKVGEGTLVSPLPFGRLPGTNATRLGDSFGVAEPPFLVAEGFDEFSTLPALEGFYRTYAWTAPLAADGVHPWEIDEFAATAARARSTLRSESLFLDLAAPVDELAAARETGQVAGRRLLLVGGQAAALLLAFAILAAAGMRRDVEGVWQRLTWFGARRYQLGVLSGAETGAAALVGVAVGWGLGVLAVAVLADRAGAPVGEILRHSVVNAGGLAAAALLVVAAVVVLLLALRAPGAPLGGLRITALDVAALGALGVVLLALARGDVSAEADAGTGTLLLLLPGLVTFICAVAFARLLGPGLRLLERMSRRSSPAIRLASLSLARNPGRAAVAVTFLVASLGLGLFAALYRSTLDDGLQAQAAYAVPLDFRVQENFSQAGLVAPLEAAPLPEYEALGADAVVPVIRQTGTVAGAGQSTLLGVPADTAAAVSDAQLEGADVELAGPDLPDDAARLELPVSVRGGDVAITAIVLTPGGGFVRIPLGTTKGRNETTLTGEIPEEARGGRVVALTLARPDAVTGHGDFERADGKLTFGDLAADGEPILTGYDDWVGFDGVEAADGTVNFLLSNEAATPRFQPRQPTDGEPVPVVVTPGLAARAGEGGVLAVRVPSGQISVRVTGVIDRFPTVSGDVILADEREALRSAQLGQPGDDGSGRAVARRARLGGRSACEAAVRRARRELPRGGATPARKRSARPRLPGDPDRRCGGRGAARAVRPRASSGGRLEGRGTRALRSRGAGRRAAHAAPPPAPAGRPRRRARPPGRARGRRAALDPHGRPRHADRERLRARAAALPLRELAPRRRRLPRLRGRGRRADRRIDEEGRMSAIEAKDLFCVFSTPEGDAAALQGLTLSVEEREVLVVLGPSGSGKSTLLRILAGLQRPSAGTARAFDADLTRLGGRRLADYRATTLGYVEQHYSRSLDPDLTARELIGVQLGLAGATRRERELRADELLERVGLTAKRDAYPRALSGGEQQRIAVCAALAHRPKLLLADEPTGELDARSAGLVTGLIGELAREHGCTTVVVTHDVETTAIADRIVRVRDGRVSEESRGNGGGDEALVVGKGGWVRLPEELVVRAGLGDRARASSARAASSSRPPGRRNTSRPKRSRRLRRPSRIAWWPRRTDCGRRTGAASASRSSSTGSTRPSPPDACVAVTGPSGSGKTTLLHLLAGLAEPTAGEVTVLGTPLGTLDREARAALRREHVAVIGQDPGLTPFLSARENVELALALRGIDEADAGERALDALAAVGLSERTEQRVARLSAGERQRVAIARALAASPSLLLADEPTARLDEANALAVGALFARLARESGAAVICATHDPLVVEQADVEVALR